METTAQWKPWKTNCMFSTVPTALGKLGKKRPTFPQFPQPYCWILLLREENVMKKRKAIAQGPNQNRVDKRLPKA